MRIKNVFVAADDKEFDTASECFAHDIVEKICEKAYLQDYSKSKLKLHILAILDEMQCEFPELVERELAATEREKIGESGTY